MKNPNKIKSIILICAAVLLFGAAGISAYIEHKQALETFRIKEQYAASQSVADEPSAEAPAESSDESSDISEIPSEQASEEVPEISSEPEPILTENPHKEAFLANGDCAAWLTIPDTVIDYPVMWTPADEEYYLYRDFNGKNNQNGCLLLDTDSSLDPITTNLIIHGHNMKSGAMFGTLTDYENEKYFDEHRVLTLYTREAEKQYEIIAVFRSQVYKKSDTVFKFYKFFRADTEEEFEDFYNNIKNLSIYDTGVTASFGDRFITLSTCTYHVKNGRFVVVAKEIGEGEHYLPLAE